jgi:16S rRNA (guanine527-N7)-methyltransferase
MDLIKKYFADLTQAQLEQFAQLGPLYEIWNQKINVISRKDIDNLYLHHVLHSLAITKFVDLKKAINIMDYGTGGGFPGLPLAIMYPNTYFDLVDSVGKKLLVVNAIAKQLGLKNVKTYHLRAENIDINYDFVVSRAVAKLDILWPNVKSNIKKDSPVNNPGMLNLRGEDTNCQLLDAIIKVWNLRDIYSEDYFKTKTLVLLTKKSVNNR